MVPNIYAFSTQL